jgi:hypothetical protein
MHKVEVDLSRGMSFLSRRGMDIVVDKRKSKDIRKLGIRLLKKYFPLDLGFRGLGFMIQHV